MKLLLVEDEPRVASFIKQGLEEQNIIVDLAVDGLAGKNMVHNNVYDIIILDVNLPHISGFELCKIIRRHDDTIPIMMLTALGTTEDKLIGFDNGADDYMVKPFEFREFLARIRALNKRRDGKDEKHILKIADLELNQDSKLVHRSGNQIDLTAKEFQLLEYLLKNKNKVVSRADIADKVWDVLFDTGTNVIDVYINFLRKKVDKGFTPKLIHTMVGMGYVIKDETERLPAEA